MIQPSAPASGPTLRDIHLPPEPSWWPPAPGWWFVSALLLLLAWMLGWWWRRRRRAAHWRRQVMDELDLLARQHQHGGDNAALAGALNAMLRRVARQHEPGAIRQRGDAWRQTLARVPVDATTLQHLLALDQHIYRPGSDFDATAVIDAVRQWLRVALKPNKWKVPKVEQADA
ncbi:MAG TPA: DUF4381 domain-containing protein [Rhodanobacter sp.]